MKVTVKKKIELKVSNVSHTVLSVTRNTSYLAIVVEGTLKVFKIQRNKHVLQTITENFHEDLKQSAVIDLCFNNKGTDILSIFGNGELKLLHLTSSQSLSYTNVAKVDVAETKANKIICSGLCFHPLDNFFAVGYRDSCMGKFSIRLFKVNSEAPLFSMTLTSISTVFKFSPDGEWLLSAGKNKIRVYEVMEYQNVTQNKILCSANVICFEFHPSDKIVAASIEDGSIELWALDSFLLLQKFRVSNQVTQNIRFFLDQSMNCYLICASVDIIEVYNMENFSREASLDIQHLGLLKFGQLSYCLSRNFSATLALGAQYKCAQDFSVVVYYVTVQTNTSQKTDKGDSDDQPDKVRDKLVTPQSPKSCLETKEPSQDFSLLNTAKYSGVVSKHIKNNNETSMAYDMFQSLGSYVTTTAEQHYENLSKTFCTTLSEVLQSQTTSGNNSKSLLKLINSHESDLSNFQHQLMFTTVRHLNMKTSAVDLEVCSIMLPVIIRELQNSFKTDKKNVAFEDTLKIINNVGLYLVKAFANIIKQTLDLATVNSRKIDIAREDRLQRCKLCQTSFSHLRSAIGKVQELKLEKNLSLSTRRDSEYLHKLLQEIET